MKHKNLFKNFGVFVSISLLAGSMAACTKTPENPVVRTKGTKAVKNYKEAESSKAKGINLYKVLGAPKTYQSEVSDSTGKLKVYTDAAVELPKASEVSAIYVSQHPFGQAEMERITKAFFDDADVYDASIYMEKTKEEWKAEIERLKGYVAAGNLDSVNWGTDQNGSYIYDIYGEIEKAEEAYKTAPKQRVMKKVEPPFPFKEEPIDPVLADPGIGNSFIGPEIGSMNSFYGIVPMEDGNYYRYEMVKSDSRPMEVSIKKVSGISEIEESRQSLWLDYVSMKTLYEWLPDKEKIASDIGISIEDAKKIADEKISKLNLQGMEMSASEYAVEIGGHSGFPSKEDLKNVGYGFHYTRKLNGIPITYTSETGGFRGNTHSEIKPWCYEALDVYVTKDGIDMASFTNQYDIGDTMANHLELMPFDDIMAIYEKMMEIQYADLFIDKRTPGADVGAPLKARTYRVNRIVFGYSRIYGPQDGELAGILVPVWDFFGEYENDYGEGGKMGGNLVREEHRSFLTINALDGTVINRQSGY